MTTTFQKKWRKRIHTIAGDTVPQRKRETCSLLARLGFYIQPKRVKQERGKLFVIFDPPFAENMVQSMATLAQYAAVLFVPRDDHPQVRHILVLFEQEPGLYFALPFQKTYHPIFSDEELRDLLSWYHRLMRERRAGMEEIL